MSNTTTSILVALLVALGAGCGGTESERAFQEGGVEEFQKWCTRGYPIADARLMYAIGAEELQATGALLLESCGAIRSLLEAGGDREAIRQLETEVVIHSGKYGRILALSGNIFPPVPLPEPPFERPCTEDLDKVAPPAGVDFELLEKFAERMTSLKDSCDMLEGGYLPETTAQMAARWRTWVRELLGHGPGSPD